MNPTPAEIAEHLSNQQLSVDPCTYAWDSPVAGRPGLYSWWVDDEGRRLLESSLEEELSSLIYAGQAGATSSRAKKPSTATLYSRIHGNHLNGTAYGSTFRKTLSALLLEPLKLTVEKPDRLYATDRKRVSEWMCEHLRLVLHPFDDRDRLGEVEDEVLMILDPPLNLQGMPSTSIRRKLSGLRRLLSSPHEGSSPWTPPPSPGEGSRHD